MMSLYATILRRISMGCALLTLVCLTAASAAAQSESVLYSFCGLSSCTDGQYPEVQLIEDPQGNLYGTTYEGGAHNGGTVFKLAPEGALTVLYSFGATSTDGIEPVGTLVRDSKGNLYGATAAGGVYRSGTVFKVGPDGTATVVHNFGASASDGLYPVAGLVMDGQGNIYGTTAYGGKGFGAGTVYEVSAKGSYAVLHYFVGGGDGLRPMAPLVLDQQGNLYGTTELGGTFGEGAVFKITSAGTESVLHSFSATGSAKADGVFPEGGLVVDAQGNLYGTTYNGGEFHTGVVFKLTPAGTETVLHSFGGTGDGLHTQAALIIDGSGNLYGTSFQGGAFGGGIVFKLDPGGNETILHSFGSGGDGAFPHAALLMDSAGNLYGTTEQGGTNNGGTVFEVTP